MKKIKYVYYISTVILSLFMLMGAYFEISMEKSSVDLLVHLGYPVYFGYLIGFGKLLGVIGIWQKKYPFLREWAYAGFVIDLLSAVASIMFVGDPFLLAVPAIINLVIVIVSYVSYRKLNAKR